MVTPTTRHLIEVGDPDPTGAFCTCRNWSIKNEPNRDALVAAAHRHILEMLLAAGKVTAAEPRS